MGVPTCPVCTSKKWRKAAGTGELICSEGHVLQGYRNETVEITEMGAHTVHRRHLRTGRRRTGRGDHENPDIYHGPRARYLYYQCRQLVLRHQIDKLVSEWELPIEAKNICRTIWLMSLEILPSKPPAQPWIHAQTEPEASEPTKGKEQTNEPMEVDKDSTDNTSDSESSENGERDTQAQIERDIEKLMYEASDTDSDPGSMERDTAKAQKAYNRETRHTLYDSSAMNISMLVLTCWWLRVPATYLDLISLINSYRVPYLDVIPLIPNNMKKHMSVALRQELNPPHAPSVTALHVITRRIARRLRVTHGVEIPEFNAAPVLWRAVRAFQGPPALYTMAKKMMERLEVPLTIHPTLAPRPSSGIQGYGGDWAPVEVTMSAVLVVILKFVYGFQEGVIVTHEADDPASCFPDFSTYIAALRRAKEESYMSFDYLLSRKNVRCVSQLSASTLVKTWRIASTADTLCSEEMDSYLEVAERALGTWSMGDSKSMPFRQLMTVYGDVQDHSHPSDSVKNIRSNAIPPEALDRPSQSQDSEQQAAKLPGEGITIWSPNDLLGLFPPDYALLIETASTWSGAEHPTINRLVTLFENRLQRSSPRWRKLEVSDLDGEYIDIDQISRSGSEGQSPSEGIKFEDEDEEVEVKTSTHTYKLGSQNWRERVHTKLSRGDHPQSAYKHSTSPYEGESEEEPESGSNNEQSQ